LRCAGYSIDDQSDQSRPRTADDLSVNHGGIVVVAVSDLALSPLSSLSTHPTTFKLVGFLVVTGLFIGIVVVLTFFDELVAILDRVAVYKEPVYVDCDFNIRLDKPDDLHAVQLRLLVESYGLVLHTIGLTHQLGGAFDAVITHADAGRPDDITVVDVALSDHHLLQWSVHTRLKIRPVAVVCSRPWSPLDFSQFCT
jgi:hypothetical protein